ncbi:MAG TPA: hypothetical protein VNF47_03205 [Streptosporangiaceae bacterium]|nr:hypothetical protein [Streptosporangiaceae bacterium]
MRAMSRRAPVYDGERAVVSTAPAQPVTAVSRIDWDGLKNARRACCCPAVPAVIAVMPAAPGRAHKTDLLLCMHHLRASTDALRAAGASVFDLDGKLVVPDGRSYLAASR